MHCANGDASLVHRAEPQHNGPFRLELFDDILGRCNPYEPHMAERDVHQWVRAVRRPRVARAYQPKNAHATSANATVMAATTNQISVLRATRLRVGLNPMSFSIAVNATKVTHAR